MRKSTKIYEKNILLGLNKLALIDRLLHWKITAEEELSPIQIRFINYIRQNPSELCTISNLAKEFDLKKPTVSDSIKNLIQKELLKKNQSEKDKRSFYLELTLKGTKKVKNIAQKDEIVRKIIENLDPEEKETVSGFFIHIISEMQRLKIIQQARLCLNCSNLIEIETSSGENQYKCALTKRVFDKKQIQYGCLLFKQKPT